jgi:hypothetical protein
VLSIGDIDILMKRATETFSYYENVDNLSFRQDTTMAMFVEPGLYLGNIFSFDVGDFDNDGEDRTINNMVYGC